MKVLRVKSLKTFLIYKHSWYWIFELSFSVGCSIADLYDINMGFLECAIKSCRFVSQSEWDVFSIHVTIKGPSYNMSALTKRKRSLSLINLAASSYITMQENFRKWQQIICDYLTRHQIWKDHENVQKFMYYNCHLELVSFHMLMLRWMYSQECVSTKVTDLFSTISGKLYEEFFNTVRKMFTTIFTMCLLSRQYFNSITRNPEKHEWCIEVYGE